MLCSCIPKSDYDKHTELNGNYLPCENECCTTCLVEELKNKTGNLEKCLMIMTF